MASREGVFAEVSITLAQVKAARKLLGWTQDQLAGKAGVSATTIARFEAAKRRPSVLVVSTIRHTLEAAGVEFTNGGQPGVRLKKP